MKKIILFFFLVQTFSTYAQNKMRPVEELVNNTAPAWRYIKQWIDTAKNKVEVLPADESKAKTALFNTQVTSRSTMGAIVYETGGILVDNGWIRILGHGHASLNRSLPDWNKGKSFKEFGESSPFLLIADDAVGGMFLVNGGGLGPDAGKVYYLSQDKLEYEPTGLSYSEFILFCFNADLEEFYKGLRWKNWREDVVKLKGDQVFSFYPFLYTKEGVDINKVSRTIVPSEEHYNFTMNARKQLGITK